MDPLLVGGLAVGLPVLFFLIWFVVNYNRFVNLRNVIAESWSDIDTELKRRHDLIPNLVSTVKGYAAHEASVLEAVTRARSQAVAASGNPGELARDENALVQTLRQVFAVSEKYPQLKADENFLKLQGELANTENRLQAARRFFNGNTREFNVLVESVPTNFIAAMFGFTRKEMFELDDLGERQPVAVNFKTS